MRTRGSCCHWAACSPSGRGLNKAGKTNWIKSASPVNPSSRRRRSMIRIVKICSALSAWTTSLHIARIPSHRLTILVLSRLVELLPKRRRVHLREQVLPYGSNEEGRPVPVTSIGVGVHLLEEPGGDADADGLSALREFHGSPLRGSWGWGWGLTYCEGGRFPRTLKAQAKLSTVYKLLGPLR